MRTAFIPSLSSDVGTCGFSFAVALPEILYRETRVLMPFFFSVRFHASGNESNHGISLTFGNTWRVIGIAIAGI